jgi:hypothetical protein
MSRWLLGIAGRFSPLIRELAETWYQFERPFVIDAHDTTTTFGIEASSWDEIVPTTLDWWRSRA